MEDDDAFDLEVYMRAFVPDAAQRRQEAILRRIRELREAGLFDDLDVTRWSNQVSVTPDLEREHPAGVEVYRELEAAIEDTDLSIQPFFRERQGLDEDRTVVSLPVICLALRRDGEICGIYPCSAPDGAYSVTDCLDALEAGDDVANVTEDVRLDPRPA